MRKTKNLNLNLVDKTDKVLESLENLNENFENLDEKLMTKKEIENKVNPIESTANSAYGMADTAMTKITSVEIRANSAYNVADTAMANVQMMQAEVQTLGSAVPQVESMATQAQTTAENVGMRVDNIENRIPTDEPIKDNDLATKKYVDEHSGGGGGSSSNNSNLINGSADGSLRTLQSAEEGDGYTIARNGFTEGYGTKVIGQGGHAEGYQTVAGSGSYAHAEGWGCEASGACTHAEGSYTIASASDSHVQGRYNIKDPYGTYAHIVGNGKGESNRANAHTLDWEGNGWYAGKLSQEGIPTEEKDVLTKGYGDSNYIPADIVKGFWVGTQNEYNELEEHDNSIIYLIKGEGSPLPLCEVYFGGSMPEPEPEPDFQPVQSARFNFDGLQFSSFRMSDYPTPEGVGTGINFNIENMSEYDVISGEFEIQVANESKEILATTTFKVRNISAMSPEPSESYELKALKSDIAYIVIVKKSLEFRN